MTESPTPEELARKLWLDTITCAQLEPDEVFQECFALNVTKALEGKQQEIECVMVLENEEHIKRRAAEAKLAELEAHKLGSVATLEVIAMGIPGAARYATDALSGANTEKWRELLDAVKNAVGEPFTDGMRPYVIERLHHAFAALHSSTGERT